MGPNFYLYRCISCNYMWGDYNFNRIVSKLFKCPRCKKSQEFPVLGTVDEPACKTLNIETFHHIDE
jgi:phage FluMu protein Com